MDPWVGWLQCCGAASSLVYVYMYIYIQSTLIIVTQRRKTSIITLLEWPGPKVCSLSEGERAMWMYTRECHESTSIISSYSLSLLQGQGEGGGSKRDCNIITQPQSCYPADLVQFCPLYASCSAVSCFHAWKHIHKCECIYICGGCLLTGVIWALNEFTLLTIYLLKYLQPHT